MGYIIVNRDHEDGVEGMRMNMRRAMRGGYRHEGIMPYMRHHDGYDHEKMYELGFRHGWEDADEEHYRRMRDSKGRYV